MQQSDQEIYTNQIGEIGEINLRGIINFFVARKFLIFGFTGFVTVLAIIVAFTLTPTYKTISLFTTPIDSGPYLLKDWLSDPEESEDQNQVDKLQFLNESNQSVFSEFLTRLSSRDFQKKIFVDGGYVTAFNPKNEPIDDVELFISGSIKSVSVNPPGVTRKELDLGFLTALAYSISMEGSNVEVMSRYLNDLVTSADKKTIDKFIKIIKQKIDNTLEELSLESRLLIIKAKQERLNEIELLSEAALIARSLGVIENNFIAITNQTSNLVSKSEIMSYMTESFTPSRLDADLVPEWFFYGETALLERIEILKNRTNDEPFIEELVRLNNKKRKYEAIMLERDGLKSMQLSQAAIPLIGYIKPNKRMIVLIAFISSFILSILLALVMDVLKPDERYST